MAADHSLLPLLTRAIASEPPGPQEQVDERILDAAVQLVGAYGAKRTSMDDIAERAGVGRATVFRRFGTKEAVIEQALARDFARFLTDLRALLVAAPDAATGTVEAFVTIVRFANTHPLLARLARMEPQTLVALVTAIFVPARAWVADRIRAGQRRGQATEADADQVAEIVTRFVSSYMVFPTTASDDELRATARATLAPIVTDSGGRR